MINKKELKQQYKESPPSMGIYCIKNLTSGKVFIGKSSDLRGKLNSIRFQLNHGSFINSELQKDYNNSGENDFSFEVIDTLETKDDPAYDYSRDLRILEQLWFEKLQPYDETGYHKRK